MDIGVSLRERLDRERAIILSLRVRPGARRTQWRSVMADGSIKIDVAAAPEDGEANAALVRFLSDECDVPLARIELLAGHTAKQKRVKIWRA